MLPERLNTITKNKIPVILLFGPTAVGKTDLLLELFKDIGEVVNADSMQVYNNLDIGSAKPSNEYIELLPHHLVSIIDPSSQFSVADFVEKADVIVRDIYSRGKIPVLAGGTAFYFKNFMYGLPSLPKVEESIRNEIQDNLNELGLKSIFAQLEKLDPNGAKEINPGDTYRVTRALEVIKQSGRSIFSYEIGQDLRKEYNFLILGLTRPREELYRRIDERVEIMFNQGLYSEFISLYNKGLNVSAPGMKGIGYSEFFQMMQAGCWGFKELKEEIKRNSRRYAKRQITFFNSFTNVNWVNPNDSDKLKCLVEEFIQMSS